jgi:hypothetical protein
MRWEDFTMRAFIAAIVATIVVAVVGVYALEALQKPASTAYSTTGVRL